jgi:hypothetical protein
MKVMASLAFYPMLWLRGIVVMLGKLVVALFTLGFCFALGLKVFADEPLLTWWMVAIAGVLAFGGFMLLELYDDILLKLNPTGKMLDLPK